MKKSRIITLISIIILGVFLFFWEDIFALYSKLTLKFPQVEKEISNLITQEIEKQINNPPPLRSTEENPQSFLTSAGVIQWTNSQREKYGLPPLKENTKLDASTKTKVEDMFENQYFAHVSPSGIEVGDLVKNVGYEFIAIGENLALGNFKNDEDLVQSWMESPGHRANILNAQYTEIGVAAVKGSFEGETTWLTVQHFGFPLSACPSPDQNLKTAISENQITVQGLGNDLEVLKDEIRAMKPRPGQRELYVQKIAEYNSLVSEYNNLFAETKNLISQYNAQILAFNNCVSGTE